MLSVPIPSNLTNGVTDGAGIFHSRNALYTDSGAISANTNVDAMTFAYTSTTTNEVDCVFTFNYEVN